MTVLLRPAIPAECSALSALCMRSKAYWGYDAAFMEACRNELTLSEADIAQQMIVAELNGKIAGVAQIGPLENDADLLLLFVDPADMGHGVGRALFDWCVQEAQKSGYTRLLIDADPGAEPFYLRMGALRVGEAASASIPGRVLPQLAYNL